MTYYALDFFTINPDIRDTMNPKYVNYVDILESINVKPYKYENVQIYKMNWTDNLALIKNDKQG